MARSSDDRLLAALAAGRSVEDAARTAGVAERTAYRDELISAALGELVDCASEAVATLRALLSAADERVRLGAAKSTLEQLLRLRETLTLNQRLAALERTLQHRQRGGR
jgi:hypothetical protein